MNVVHADDPFQLIGGFEVFGDAVGIGELLAEAVAHFIGLMVNDFQVRIQGFPHLHGAVDGLEVILQIVVATLAPDADIGKLRKFYQGDADNFISITTRTHNLQD